jgi:hypothetical protein
MARVWPAVSLCRSLPVPGLSLRGRTGSDSESRGPGPAGGPAAGGAAQRRGPARDIMQVAAPRLGSMDYDRSDSEPGKGRARGPARLLRWHWPWPRTLDSDSDSDSRVPVT